MERLMSRPFITNRQTSTDRYPNLNRLQGAHLLSATAIVHQDHLIIFARGPLREDDLSFRSKAHLVYRWSCPIDEADLSDPLCLTNSAPEVIDYADIGVSTPTAGGDFGFDLGAISVVEFDSSTLKMYVRYGDTGESYMLTSTDLGVTWTGATKLVYAAGGDFTTASPGFTKIGSTWYMSKTEKLRDNGGVNNDKPVYGILVHTSSDLITWSDSPIATLDPDVISAENEIGDTSFITSWMTNEDGYLYIVLAANGLEPADAGAGGFFHDSPRGFCMYRLDPAAPSTIEEYKNNPFFVRREDQAACWSPTLIFQGDDLWVIYEGETIDAEVGSSDWNDARDIQYDGYGVTSWSTVYTGIVRGVSDMGEFWGLPRLYQDDTLYSLTDHKGRMLRYSVTAGTVLGYTGGREEIRLKDQDGFTLLQMDTANASLRAEIETLEYVVRYSVDVEADDFRRHSHIVKHGDLVKIVDRETGLVMTALPNDTIRLAKDKNSDNQYFKLSPLLS